MAKKFGGPVRGDSLSWRKNTFALREERFFSSRSTGG